MRYRYHSIILFVLSTLLPQLATAGIHGSFNAKGMTTEITLKIDDPPPLSVIVEQQTPGVHVQSTSPQAAKIDGERATWLVKRPSAGNLKLKTLLSAPQQSLPQAMIKYKDPATGKYIQQQIQPKP